MLLYAARLGWCTNPCFLFLLCLCAISDELQHPSLWNEANLPSIPTHASSSMNSPAWLDSSVLRGLSRWPARGQSRVPRAEEGRSVGCLNYAGARHSIKETASRGARRGEVVGAHGNTTWSGEDWCRRISKADSPPTAGFGLRNEARVRS